MNRKARRLYATNKQIRFLEGRQLRKTMIGGRGTGKSVTISFQDRIRMEEMPRAKTFLAGPYFGQLLTKTIPAYLDGLHSFGWEEYDPVKGFGHYVAFKRPPSSWIKPYHESRDYSKLITFPNGYCKELISLYGADSGRGGSYDAGDVDESALCDKDDIDRVLIPSLRGNLYRITSDMHYQLCDYTSPAWLPSGQWVYDTEQLMKEFPKEYLFVESSTRDNAAISEHQIKLMERTLPRLVFDVEVEGKRITRLPNGFYPTFSDKKHVVFDTTRHQYDDKKGLWLTSESYLDKSQSIETSWDFNAAFTSLIVAQQIEEEERIDNNLFVKESTESSLVVALCQLFAKEYESHGRKRVEVHGDRNGNNKSAGNPLTHYEEIKKTLQSLGWEVELKVSGLDSEHHTRQMVIADILGEGNPNRPTVRINGNKCKALIYAIQNTPILPDFKKDKSSERSAMAQEKATHLTDCLDNLLIRKFAHYFGRSSTRFTEPTLLGS
jgi:hypothetical protein